MQDRLLELVFADSDRWTRAIDKAVDKDIDRKQVEWLRDPMNRILLKRRIQEGTYKIEPPYTAKIPKNEYEQVWNEQTQKYESRMKYRTVYINTPIPRVLFGIINDVLIEQMPERIHPCSKAYQHGIGCGKVVKGMSKAIVENNAKGYKSTKGDISKYFDSVFISSIDHEFDLVEQKLGESSIIRLVRDYYHSGWYYDSETDEVRNAFDTNPKGLSLRQGCAVASYLANAVLCEMDERVSKMDVEFIRYCDDFWLTGREHDKAMAVIHEELAKHGLELHPNKLETLSPDKWFKFLGFSIKGDRISLSESRIRSFCEEICKRTTDLVKTGVTYEQALKKVYRYLYFGNGEHSWATQVLTTINCKEDVVTLNTYVVDKLRAVITRKCRVGGLSYYKDKEARTIIRERGANVRKNREKVPELQGYTTIGCMMNAINTDRGVYKTLCNQLMI